MRQSGINPCFGGIFDMVQPSQLDTLRATRQSIDKLPVIDLSPLIGGGRSQKVKGETRWPIANSGFMYAKKHAVYTERTCALIDLSDEETVKLQRVLNTSDRERYSMPIFVDADYNATFEPLPSCIDADNPVRYEQVTCGVHKFSRFVKSFPHLQNEVA